MVSGIFRNDECNFALAGRKPLEVCWLHGKEEIKADSKIYQMERDGTVHRLVIAEVYPEDGGVYLCEAYNEYGDAESSCFLTVEEGETMKCVQLLG